MTSTDRDARHPARLCDMGVDWSWQSEDPLADSPVRVRGLLPTEH